MEGTGESSQKKKEARELATDAGWQILEWENEVAPVWLVFTQPSMVRIESKGKGKEYRKFEDGMGKKSSLRVRQQTYQEDVTRLCGHSVSLFEACGHEFRVRPVNTINAFLSNV